MELICFSIGRTDLWVLVQGQPRQHIKKQRHYFVNKGPSSQSFGFSSSHVWCESWTIKQVEHWRIDAFELWCWRRLLKVPWTARISNQSILKEISPEYSLEGLMLKLKLQYLGHLMQRIYLKRPWCWKWLKAGGEGDHREWDGWMASPTQWTWVWVSSRNWWWAGKLGVLQSMGLQRVRHDWVAELNWTELRDLLLPALMWLWLKSYYFWTSVFTVIIRSADHQSFQSQDQ